MAGRQPDFDLCVMTRKGVTPARRGKVGAAWTNLDGSISVRLNPFVQIALDGSIVVTLFPRDGRAEPYEGGPDDE